jgi:ketosteroid isomerase-like protein
MELMKRNGLFPMTAIAAVLFAACGAPADNPLVRSANSEGAKPIADAPVANALLALDRQVNEAFLKGDAASLEGLLSDQFVMLGPGGARMDKVATTAMVAGVRCDVKDGWTLDEPHLSAIDADTYVLSYRGTFDGTCTLDGRTEKAPSPVRAATVWVRNGERWLAAFHGENPIFDPRITKAPPAAPAARKEAPNEDDKTAPDAGPAAPAADPGTVAMVAIETSVWEAWKARDAKLLEELTARDLAFVDIFGNVTSGKAETIKFWTEHQCDLQSVRVADGTGTSLSATVGILTFKGILEGTCGGQKFPLIYGTSVYTRDGDAWKLAFTLNHLTN